MRNRILRSMSYGWCLVFALNVPINALASPCQDALEKVVKTAVHALMNGEAEINNRPELLTYRDGVVIDWTTVSNTKVGARTICMEQSNEKNKTSNLAKVASCDYAIDKVEFWTIQAQRATLDAILAMERYEKDKSLEWFYWLKSKVFNDEMSRVELDQLVARSSQTVVNGFWTSVWEYREQAEKDCAF